MGTIVSLGRLLLRAFCAAVLLTWATAEWAAGAPGAAAPPGYADLHKSITDLRNVVRDMACFVNPLEIRALLDQGQVFSDQIGAAEKADPGIKNDAGGWQADRLDTLLNRYYAAVKGLSERPCIAGTKYDNEDKPPPPKPPAPKPGSILLSAEPPACFPSDAAKAAC